MEFLRIRPQALPYLHPSLLEDPNIVLPAVSRHPLSIRRLPAPIRTKIAGGARNLLSQLTSLGIEFPQRMAPMIRLQLAYSITDEHTGESLSEPACMMKSGNDLMSSLIENRLTPHKVDGRPLAVVIFPRADHNGAFENRHARKLLGDLALKHRVLYYEAQHDEDAIAQLNEASKAQQPSIIVLGGHGTRTSPRWDRTPGDTRAAPIDDEENEWQDWMPEDRGRYVFSPDDRDNFMARLSPSLRNAKQHIVLVSCSTGKGRNKESNVANLVGEVFPNSTVHAPVQDAPVPHLQFGPRGRLTKVIYKQDPEIEYQISSATRLADIIEDLLTSTLLFDPVTDADSRRAYELLRDADNPRAAITELASRQHGSLLATLIEEMPDAGDKAPNLSSLAALLGSQFTAEDTTALMELLPPEVVERWRDAGRGMRIPQTPH